MKVMFLGNLNTLFNGYKHFQVIKYQHQCNDV